MHPNRRDQEQVQVMTACGASPEHIAKHLNLNLNDLLCFYKVDLDFGLERANMEVARTFHKLASSGEYPNLTLAWMRMRAGWKDAINQKEPEEDTSDAELTRSKLVKLLNRGAKAAQTQKQANGATPAPPQCIAPLKPQFPE